MRLLLVIARGFPLLAVILAVAGPARAVPPDEAGYRGIATRMVEGFAAPASQAFVAAVQHLGKATGIACTTKGPAPDTLRQSFRNTAQAWGRLSLARFGPLTDDSRYDRIAFWPDPRGVTRRQAQQLLAQMPEDGELVAWISGQSAAVQGLPAFDLVMFGEDAAESWARNCRMAVAIAGNLERMAAAVAAGFADPGHLAILSPKPDDTLYRTWQDSVASLFTIYSTQIEVLRATIVGDMQRQAMISSAAAAAATPPQGAEARPTRVFLRYAPATKAFLVGAVGGFDDVLATMKLDPYVADDPRGLQERSSRELQALRDAVDALPPDLTATLADPSTLNQLSVVSRRLEGFQRIVSVGYMPALGLKAGFNALDGD